MNPISQRPPLYPALCDLVGWTLDRTASLPRSQRFTFGERLDNLTLNTLELMIESLYAKPSEKLRHLGQINLHLEKLRVLWRLTCDRGWISERQLGFVTAQLDEIGRMTGGWIKQVQGRNAGRDFRR